MELLADENTIEHAQHSDLPRVLDLWMELMLLTGEFNERYALAPDARRHQESYLRDFFESDQTAIFVARAGGVMAGFEDIYITRPSAVFAQHNLGIIENIYVLPEYRRRGFGRRLVERAHDFFRRRSADEVYVNVVPANELSELFWRGMGYRTQKITMSYQGL